MDIQPRLRHISQMHFGFSSFPDDESKYSLICIGLLIMLANIALSLLILVSQLSQTESVSGSKRVILQRFFGNLNVFCYGTCSNTNSGFVGITKDVRCLGKQVRLECKHNHVIKINFAFYGELDPGKELCKDASSVLEQCRKDVSQIVAGECDNKKHCLIKVGNDRFKDTCQSDYFYLDIRHSCVIQPTTHKPSTKQTTEKTTSTTTTTTTQAPTKTTTTTKRLTSAAKPITIYKDTTRRRTQPTMTKTNTKKSSSKLKPIKTNSELFSEGTMTSSSSFESTSSSSAKDGSSSKQNLVTRLPLTRSNGPKQKVNSSVIKSAGRTGKEKASMYWLLTAYSLVTDKSFMQANSTHMVLAIILSIFIAMVLLTCFILDHCRRKRRYEALNESKEVERPPTTPEPPQENGHSPMDLEIRRGLIRPKSKLRPAVSAMSNGTISRQSTRSLDEMNHSVIHSTEKLSLLPLSTSLDSVERNGIEETSFLIHPTLSDCLPPPPDELLHDSPHQNRAKFYENGSSSSSLSIPPPPQGFGDSDNDETHPLSLNPEVIITSPTDSSISSIQTFPRSRPSDKASSKINNSGRLNNELHHGNSTIPRDNLLQNHVCIQTNDLSKMGDKLMRIENRGLVSMRSPELETPDLCSIPDSESKALYPDSIDDMIFLKLNSKKQMKQSNNKNVLENTVAGFGTSPMQSNDADESHSECTTGTINRRPKNTKGHLVVLKTETTENPKNTTMRNEQRNIPDSSFDAFDSSLSQENDPVLNTMQKHHRTDGSLTEVTSAGSKAKTFVVPKHRCGLGHSHTCVCTPLRTSGNSYICSCLEKAKQNETKCCIENCAEGKQMTGRPYSSARPSRRPHQDTLKAKCNRERRLSSSLTDISQIRKEKRVFELKKNGNAIAASNTSATLPRNPHVRRYDKQSANEKLFDNPSKQRQETVNKMFTKERQSKDQTLERCKKPKKARFSSNDKESSILRQSKIPTLARTEESSDSSERSDASIDAVQSKSLPTSPTKTSRLKNDRMRLSPISEDLKRNQRNKSPNRSPRTRQSPRFKIQVVQSLHTNKHHPIKEV